jgi:hypothetical protein
MSNSQRWKVQQHGWFTSAGEFSPSSPQVDILPDVPITADVRPIASNLNRQVAEHIVALHNCYLEKSK